MSDVIDISDFTINFTPANLTSYYWFSYGLITNIILLHTFNNLSSHTGVQFVANFGVRLDLFIINSGLSKALQAF